MAEPRGAPVLMVQGTGSGVGKSLLVAALCRLARRRGVRVAPFKAQNMSNNAAVTACGGEIGRAQALQALAAGVEAEVVMNPILLKPMADTRSEVVRLGHTDRLATDRPWRERREILWPVVTDAIAQLRGRFELVIAEGAGSPAETNLRDSDIVNMAVARHTHAHVLLVADIDRGGAFASLFGTWALLEDADRTLFRGFVLNRFRGDPSLLAPAPEDLARRTGVPVLGVVPWVHHHLPEEDGGPALEGEDGLPVIGVVGYPRASNLDDLDPLRHESTVRLRWVRRPSDLAGVVAIVLPGSRNTLDDLRWTKENGLADVVRGLAADGVAVVGLCGGYQMMGARVTDPDGVEGGGSEEGLGLLDVRTELAPQKEIRRTRAHVIDGGAAGATIDGYEIHHGKTVAGPGMRVWLNDGEAPLGYAAGPHWGCYLHGVFTDDAFRQAWLASLGVDGESRSWTGVVERELDRVADVVEDALDVDGLFASVVGRR